jgi:hypothetical protein
MPAILALASPFVKYRIAAGIMPYRHRFLVRLQELHVRTQFLKAIPEAGILAI